MESDGEYRPFIGSARKNNMLCMACFISAAIGLMIAEIVLSSISLVDTQKSFSTIEDVDNYLDHQNPVPRSYPTIFSLPVYSAVRNQGNRGTCWAFATMRFVEDRYAHEGIAEGFLQANTYVRFSEEAYGKSIIDYCTSNPDRCPDTPEARGNATDGYASWLYLFEDYLHGRLVVDMPSCKYTPRHGSDSSCGNYDEFVESSQIDYEVRAHHVYYDVERIKRALVDTARPMLLTIELYRQNYYVPCDAEFGYGDTAECRAAKIMCPAKLQNAEYSRHCVKLDRLATLDGRFELNNTEQTDLAAHVLLLVGFNKKGLLVYNSWGPQLSHSIRYLTDEISNRDDAHVCTNTQDPRKWVPVEHDMNYYYKLRDTTILKYVEGGFQPGHEKLASMATIAEAFDKIFNDSHYYAVESIAQMIDDTVSITFAYSPSIKSALNGEFSATVTSPPVAIEALSFFFEPQGITDEVKPYDDECGYYEISYDYIDFVKSENGAFFVDDMDIEFDPESYVANMQDGFAKNATTNATRVWSSLDFKTQTPWQDNVEWVPRWK